jgi:hypothetical protein
MMLAASESPCDPSALAAAVRTLARDARLALKGPHTQASLAELAQRTEAPESCLAGRPMAPMVPRLGGLAGTLGHAQAEECARGHLPFRANANRGSADRVRPLTPDYRSGLKRATA